MDGYKRVGFGSISSTIFVLVAGVSGAMGLRDVRITVPPMIRSRDSALLTCDYDLEGADLYSIKWYHEEEEFYRYVPKEEPPQAAFLISNIHIDPQHSNMRDVTLVNVSTNLSGKYRCEISADSPSFHTAIKTAPMFVVDVPKSDPVIEPERQRLSAGELLRVNCTSGASRPPPNISWALNGNSLNSTPAYFKIQSWVSGHDDLQITQSSLELKTTANLFKDSKLVLRCFATISPVYKASSELIVAEDTPLIASIIGDASPHSHQSNGSSGLHHRWLETGFLSLLTVASTAMSRKR